MLEKFIRNSTLYGTVLVFLLWYVLYFTVRSAIIPSPHETVVTFLRILPSPLLFHLVASFGRIIAAVAAALAVGVPLGLWIGMSEKMDRLAAPVVYVLYPIPKIAFLPVFMVLFGLGNLPKILLIMTVIVFQIIVTARDAVKELSWELFYSVRSLGMDRLQIYRHLVFPAVLPKIITSLRISIGTAIAVLFFSENFAVHYGIGHFIMNSWVMVNYTEMFSGILGLSLMGLGLFKLVDVAENRLCAWVKAGKIKDFE